MRDVRLCPPADDAQWPEVVLLCHHSKTKLCNGGVTLSQRFVAPRVAECLLIYLLCIRPITDRIRTHLLGLEPPLPYLFLDSFGQRQLQPETFSSYFSSLSLGTREATQQNVYLKPSEGRHGFPDAVKLFKLYPSVLLIDAGPVAVFVWLEAFEAAVTRQTSTRCPSFTRQERRLLSRHFPPSIVSQ